MLKCDDIALVEEFISVGVSANVKAGKIAAASFTGSPRTATVTLTPAFADKKYVVTVTGGDGRSFIVPSSTRLAGSFVVNAQAAAALSDDTYWVAVYTGI